MEAVAPSNEIASQFVGYAILSKSDFRLGAIEIMHADVFDLEQDLSASGDAGIGQIFDDLVLGIDGDSFSTGEVFEIDAMTVAMEAQLDSIVNQAFTLHPLAHSHFHEQINRALLQDAGTDALLNVLAATVLDHDRVNSLQMEKVGKDETGWSGTYDSDLCA